MPTPLLPLPEDDNAKVAINVRLPVGLLRRIRALAERDQRSITQEAIWLLAQAVERESDAQ